MPFVLQIFNVFRRFQAQINVAIPEDTEIQEKWIYVTPYKGGFHNKSIIPLVRRNIAKKNFTKKVKEEIVASNKQDFVEKNKEKLKEVADKAKEKAAKETMDKLKPSEKEKTSEKFYDKEKPRKKETKNEQAINNGTTT